MEEVIRKVNWISPEEDLEQLFKSEKYDRLAQLSEENEDLLVRLYKKKEYHSLHDSIQFGRFLLKYFKRMFFSEPRSMAILRVGKLMGYVEVMDRLRFAEDQTQIALDSARYSKTKHLDDIVFILETHGSVSQTELAKMLDMQMSTLSESLKKIRGTGFVQVAPYGKYKMYSLTEEGIRYGAMRRKKSNHQSECLQAIEVLNKYIENEDTKEDCLNQLKMKLDTKDRKFIAKNDEFEFYDVDSRQCEKVTVRSILRKQSNSQKSPEDIFIVQKAKDLKSDYIEDNILVEQFA